MASPSQPWMLQRAKWESLVNEEFNEGEYGEHSCEGKPTRSDLMGWVRLLDGEEIDVNIESSNAGKEGLAFQIGALRPKTKEASAVTTQKESWRE